ncbi:MAG: SPFH domain-containing protein [Deltaproteobacteria bacterium]|nr:SPFH domain-containing protein [Deltaproteobacteria bacterium]
MNEADLFSRAGRIAQTDAIDPTTLLYVIGAAAGIGLGILILIQVLKSFLYIARPNEVLVFSGRRYQTEDGQIIGYRVVKSGHRAFRIPIIEIVNSLDMTTIPVDVVVRNAYSKGNIPIEIHAVANVKIHSDERILRNAIERFLNKSRAEIQMVAQQTLEGVLREVLAQLTPEEVNEDRLKFAEKLMQVAEDDFHILGLQLDTLKIQSVSDSTGYLDSIGRPKIAAALRDAENAESQANQEIQQAQAEAEQRAELARATAQMAIQTKQNELRQILAQLEGEARAVEMEAEAAAKTARAMAELELQALRAQLEQKRLQAEVVIPSEFRRRAQEIEAKGLAAPTIENGIAAGEVLRAMADAWASMGQDARQLFVIQHLEQIVDAVVRRLGHFEAKEVRVVDGGDGSAIAAYAASRAKMIGTVLKALADSTGVDVPALLLAQDRGGR